MKMTFVAIMVNKHASTGDFMRRRGNRSGEMLIAFAKCKLSGRFRFIGLFAEKYEREKNVAFVNSRIYDSL